MTYMKNYVLVFGILFGSANAMGNENNDIVIEKDGFNDVKAQLADGVARLTVHNFAHLLSGASVSDLRPECKLETLGAKPAFENISNGVGDAVWNFEACEYDFGSGTVIKGSKFRGKVVLSGQRRVHGFLTGDEKQPVIPGPSGIKYSFSDVAFENFAVETPSLDGPAMTIKNGRASFDMSIVLSKNPNTNLFTHRSGALTLSNIRYTEMTNAILSLSWGQFHVAIEGCDMQAQFGKFGVKENHLQGTITIFGESHLVPSDNRGLDPSYVPNRE